MQVYEGDVYHGWAEYVIYGGLPLTVTMKTEEQKINYLTKLFEEKWNDKTGPRFITNKGEAYPF